MFVIKLPKTDKTQRDCLASLTMNIQKSEKCDPIKLTVTSSFD